MKIFSALQVEEAIEFAAVGGQALHLHRIIPDRDKAPRCFVQAVDKGEDIAHLFDKNRDRLLETAKLLGVQVLHVDRDGTARQHIDLCGKPLAAAKTMAADYEYCEQMATHLVVASLSMPIDSLGGPVATIHHDDVAIRFITISMFEMMKFARQRRTKAT